MWNVANARPRASFEAVTEPAGFGDYAEAMRELIATLAPCACRGLVDNLNHRTAAGSRRPAGRASRPQLRLVR